MAHRFKVGDLVTGKENAPYGITNSDAIMKVKSVGGHYITVQVLETPRSMGQGNSFDVEKRYFKKYTKPYMKISENYEI